MKKIALIGIGIVALSVGSVWAEGQAAAPAEAPKADAPQKVQKAPAVAPPLEDVVVSGVVTEEKDKKDKVFLVLVGEDGSKVRLPGPKGKDAVNMKDMVGAKVKVTGKGYVKDVKGKKVSMLKTITAVEKLGAPAAQ